MHSTSCLAYIIFTFPPPNRLIYTQTILTWTQPRKEAINSKPYKQMHYFLSVLSKQRVMYSMEDFRKEREVKAWTPQGAEDAY